MLVIASNITSRNDRVASAMKSREAGYLQGLAQQCLHAGANILEINLQGKHDRPDVMEFSVQALQKVTSAPLCLSTNNVESLEAGLKSCRNGAIVNYIAQEELRLQKMLPLAARHNAQVILFLASLNPAIEGEEAFKLASVLAGAANEAGITNDRIFIDPGIVHINTTEGQRRVQVFRELLPSLDESFEPPLQTTCWIGNASSSLPRRLRLAINSALLAMLAGLGLSSAFINVLERETMRTVRMIKIMKGDLLYADREIEL